MLQAEIISKSQKIGVLALRGALIGVIILSSLLTLTMISIPFDSSIDNPLRYYITKFSLIGGGLGLILFTLIFYFGLTLTFYNKIRLNEINFIFFKQVITNRKIFVIISLIVANFTLSFIPQMFLFPFYGQLLLFGQDASFAFPLDIGKELDQPILIEIVQNILEHPDLEPGIFGRLIRLIAIGVLICTVFSLVWSLINIFKDTKQLNRQTTFRMIILELWFTVGILILLLFNIIGPIWEFVDPFGFQELWWFSFSIVLFLIIPLSNFFLLFLITGNFWNGYFVIEDVSKINSRLFFAALLTLILVGYSWILISIPA